MVSFKHTALKVIGKNPWEKIEFVRLANRFCRLVTFTLILRICFDLSMEIFYSRAKVWFGEINH